MSDIDFDPVVAGLKPYPTTNTIWGASKYWDTREPYKGWKRVPGCIRIVKDSIPDPIPYYAEDYFGWRAVPTADGRVFDFETGHQIRDMRKLVSVVRTTEQRAQPKASAKKAAKDAEK